MFSHDIGYIYNVILIVYLIIYHLDCRYHVTCV